MAEPGTSYTGLDTAAWIAYGATVLCYGAFFFVGFRFTRHLQISRMLSANGFFVSKMVLQKNSEVTSVQALRNIIIASTFVGGFAFTQGVAALDRVSVSRQARGSNELRPQDVRDTVLGIVLLIGFVCFALAVRAAAHLTFLMCSATGQLSALDFPGGVCLARHSPQASAAPEAGAGTSAAAHRQSPDGAGAPSRAQQLPGGDAPAAAQGHAAPPTLPAGGGDTAVPVPAWPAPLAPQTGGTAPSSAGAVALAASPPGRTDCGRSSSSGVPASRIASGLHRNGGTSGTATAIELDGPVALALAADARRRTLSAVDIEMGQGPLPRAVSRRVFSELEQGALEMSPAQRQHMVAISKQISEKIAAPLQALEAAEIGAFCEVMMRRTNISLHWDLERSTSRSQSSCTLPARWHS